MAGLIERFLDGPVFGGDKDDGIAAEMVEKARLKAARDSGAATMDSLPAPDWGTNMELCDKINADVHTHGKDAAKALRKRLTNGTAKTQLLALTALEAAVKNCGRRFHEIVAQKEALQAMAKLASSRKSDPEVREKAASLIQEWSDAIRLAPYRDTYADLQSKGVDFPPRDVHRMTPIHTPPVSVPGEMTEADAAAIAEAIRQSEAELTQESARMERVESATREHVREAMSGGYDFMNARKAEKRLLGHQPREYMAVPDGYTAPPPIYAPSQAQQAQARPAYWGEEGSAAVGETTSSPQAREYGFGSFGAASPPGPSRMPPSPPSAQAALTSMETASATVEVLNEMLRCIDPQRPAELLADDTIAQLVSTCRSSLAPQLQEVCLTASEEGTLAQALAVNDEMQRVLEVYDYLLAAAKQGASAAVAQPYSTAALSSSPPPALPPKPARLAAASPGSVWGGAAAGAPPEEARLQMRERARSRGAALLEQAGLRLAPPPSTRQRAPQSTGEPVSGVAPPSTPTPTPTPAPASAFDLLAELDLPPPPSASLASAASVSGVPSGFNAYANPSFDAGYAPPQPAQPVTLPPAAALADELDRSLGLSPPTSPVTSSPVAVPAGDVFASLPPVLPASSPPAQPPPASGRWATAGPASMRAQQPQQPQSTSPSSSNPFV